MYRKPLYAWRSTPHFSLFYDKHTHYSATHQPSQHTVRSCFTLKSLNNSYPFPPRALLSLTCSSLLPIQFFPTKLSRCSSRLNLASHWSKRKISLFSIHQFSKSVFTQAPLTNMRASHTKAVSTALILCSYPNY